MQSLATGVVSNTRSREISVTVAENDYIYYCLPSRLGTATFNSGLGEGGFVVVANTQSLSNTSSYVEDYRIYRSTYPLQAGTYTITVT